MLISPLAREAVTGIDAVFDAERAITGLDTGARLAVRQREIAPAGRRARDVDAP
jgi:hypothetical protein